MINCTTKYFIHIIVFISIIGCSNPHKDSKPNFIIILADDLGYGDLSSFGADHVSTPNIDRLANQGAKLTSFYMAGSVCTPSRAALLTGSYPKRIDMANRVLLAGDSKGLNPTEITIAEVLKKQGYTSGIFGKWHLGDQPEFLPTRQGFDEFFGIPYSHDIHPFHPRQEKYNFPPLPLLEGETVVEMNPDADYFTKRFTERATQFIEKHRENPFFLYLAHPMPHHPIHVSPSFMSTVFDSIRALIESENEGINYSARDRLYPQAISEIDWFVGKIVDKIEQLNLEKETLIIFTSDNGPDATHGNNEPLGSAGPLRGRKGSTFEGGFRVPAVAWWPDKISAGMETDALLTAMDLLPTFANLAGAGIPKDRVIDGKNIWPILSGQTDSSPHDRFFYYYRDELRAIRSGRWKYHQTLPRRHNENGESNTKNTALYDLEADIGETQDLSDQYPEIVKKLQGYIKAFKSELRGTRPAGWVVDPEPLSKK